MMKKWIVLTGLLVFTLSLSHEAYSQRRGNQGNDDIDEYFDESGGFAHRLWYGGGFILGFSGGNFSTNFQIGVSPMVGYKLTNNFSVGPRFSLVYTHYREQLLNGEVETANPVAYSVAGFVRQKVFRSLFAHAEYELENEGLINRSTIPFQIERVRRNNIFLGAGYNSSAGLIGYEILALYNVNLPDNSFESPFSFRFGITYKF